MGKLIKMIEPKRLIDKRIDLLGANLGDIRKPPSPISCVDKQHCEILDLSRSVHSLYIIPMFFALCLLCCWRINDFREGWKGSERMILSALASDKKIYGEDFYKNTNDPEKLYWFNKIGSDEKMSFQEYLNRRYNNKVSFKIDIFFLILGGVVVPCYGIWAFGFKRRAPLFFDRERQLVYTWRFGRAWVQRYDDLQLHENNSALIFVLRGFMKTGQFGFFKFPVSPSGNPHFNFVMFYQPVLAFIAKFMEFGLYPVFPDGPWKAGPSYYFFGSCFYLFIDKKPKDFEQQLTRILQKLDEDKAGEA